MQKSFFLAMTVGLAPLLSADEPSAETPKEHHYFSKSEHQHHAEWSYAGPTGPAQWGELSPEYRLASQGRKQSPIDIPLAQARKRQLPPLEFDYRTERLTVINNGHTIQHNERPGSFLYIGKDKYALEQFHVHLPSEHTIDGKQFDMEIHLVHKSETGEVAVVAVMVNAGKQNSVEVPPLHLPTTEGEEKVAFRGARNPATLIPSERSYLTYTGSFTTPPCTEGVRWIVMTTPIEAAERNIEKLRRATGGNNRPVQNRNGRSLFISN